MRPRVLFFAESVTSAQVTRLATLAGCLPEEMFDVHFASARFEPLVFGGTSFQQHRVRSVEPDAAARALRAGRRIYDRATLEGYVKEELSLFERLAPALVIGDFRLSLGISAPLRRVPYAALINAYWHPTRLASDLPVPDHPVVRVLGERLTGRFFPRAAPYAFAHFAAPVNDLRRRHGLREIGDLPAMLNFADHVLHPDPPELVPVEPLPAHHEYLGYVPWAPAGNGVDFPADALGSRPRVYVTLGSSGRLDVLPRVVEALAGLDVSVVLSTAGRVAPRSLPPGFHVAPFVPGDLAARGSRLVISNGGSSTGYQALAEGVPVLGLPSNLDQFLAMAAIERCGAGISLPARSATAAGIHRAVSTLIDSEHHHRKARQMKEYISRSSYSERFISFVERVTGHRGTPLSAARVARSMIGVVLSALALAADGGVAHAEGSAPITNEIRFSVSVRGPAGHVVCALFRRSGWLKNPVQWQRAAIRKGHADCVFTAVARNDYAISAFHDENDDTKLDTNFLGIPTESWCTSRDAKAFFGPPSFDAARFVYRGDVMRLSGSLD